MPPAYLRWVLTAYRSRAVDQGRKRSGQTRQKPDLSVELLGDRVVPAVVMTPYVIPDNGHIIPDLVVGADGNLWFGDSSSDDMVRMALDGSMTRFPTATQGEMRIITHVVRGSDSKVWYTYLQSDFGVVHSGLGKIGVDGTISEVPLAISHFGESRVLAGSDGNAWFLDQDSNRIGRLSADGTITEFGDNLNLATRRIAPPEFILAPTAPPEFIAAPDGKLWFTEPTVSRVGWIDPLTAQITEIQGLDSQPVLSLNIGPDGNVWGTPLGQTGRTIFLPSGETTHSDLVFGVWGTFASDGNLWSQTESGLSKVTPSGTMTLYKAASEALITQAVASPLVATSDGSLWCIVEGTEHVQSWYPGPQIVRFKLNGPPPPIQIDAVTVNIVTAGERLFLGRVAVVQDTRLYQSSDSNPNAPFTVYDSALVDYGDGSPPEYQGLLRGDTVGIFYVTGDHVYQTAGTYAITVTLGVRPPDGGGGGGSDGGVGGSPHLAFQAVPQAPAGLLVGQLYRDLLQRDAEPTGLNYWVGRLNQGASHDDVVKGIQSSPEYRGRAIDGLYKARLARHAEAFGMGVWMDFLAHSGALAQVDASLLSSPEYLSSHGNTNLAFLDALYHDVLGRPVETFGQDVWMKGLAGGMSRQAVALQVLASHEAEHKIVRESYDRVLHRSPDDPGSQYWFQFLQAGNGVDELVRALLASDEYYQRVTSPQV